jgi:two-component system OmpR family response regulator
LDGLAMTRCLLVDDDSEIRTSLGDYLARYGMQVVSAADGAEMRSLMNLRSFDVVVLDLMLPDESGLTLCKWVEATYGTPVVMLTAQGDSISRVLGLEIGADDYVAKPFEPRELVARIGAVVRRARKGRGSDAGAGGDNVVRFNGWSFSLSRRQLVSPEKVVIALSSAEFRLLSAFVRHAGRVLTRDQLIDFTRGVGTDVNDRSIDLAVSRLRQKLGESPRKPQMIVTLRGEGYLFDVQVNP